MTGEIATCKRCGKERKMWAKGYCSPCYKRYGTPERRCVECGQIKPHKGNGLCAICYARSRLELITDYNIKREYNISPETYRKITKKCLLCSFNTIVDLHHIDFNHKNNELTNLVGLCPNHHKMAHLYKYEKEMRKLILEKKHGSS